MGRVQIAMEQRFGLAGVLAEHGVLLLRAEGAGAVRVLEARLTDLPAVFDGLKSGERVVGEGPGWGIAILREGAGLDIEITGDAGAMRDAIAGLGTGFGGG